jgi:hypothetical protein
MIVIVMVITWTRTRRFLPVEVVDTFSLSNRTGCYWLECSLGCIDRVLVLSHMDSKLKVVWGGEVLLLGDSCGVDGLVGGGV